MKVAGLDLNLAVQLGRVTSFKEHACSEGTVCCIIPPSAKGPGYCATDDQAKRLDAKVARLFEQFVQGGVRLFCLPDPLELNTESALLGPQARAVLGRLKSVESGRGVDEEMGDERKCLAVAVRCVDDPSVVAAMTRLYVNACSERMGVSPLLSRTGTSICELAASFGGLCIQAISVALRGRQQWNGLSQEARALLSLNSEVGEQLPAETTRILRSFEQQAEVDHERAQREREELMHRLQGHIRCGLVKRVSAQFRDSSTGSPLHHRFATETGYAPLSEPELKTLTYCKEVLSNLQSGVSDRTPTLWTRRAFAEERRLRFSERLRVLHSWSVRVFQLFELARLLGIGLDAYSMLRKQAESSHLLHSLEGPNVGAEIRSHFDKARIILVNHICAEPRERELLDCAQQLLLLERLVCIDLAHDEFETLIVGQGALRMSGLLEWLSKVGATVAPEDRNMARSFDALAERCMRFYEYARERATRMALETVSQMRHCNAGQALMVCEGFYLPVVTSVLSAAKLSHVVIQPSLRVQEASGGGDA